MYFGLPEVTSYFSLRNRSMSRCLAFGLIVEIGFKIGIAFVLLGALDFFLQTFLHRRDLKMTKHEIKEEYKETEGNPLVKSRRRSLHRELLEGGIAAAVKRADIIVANPTHLAVAIEYDREEFGAPEGRREGRRFDGGADKKTCDSSVGTDYARCAAGPRALRTGSRRRNSGRTL